jgi:hypothetical protein
MLKFERARVAAGSDRLAEALHKDLERQRHKLPLEPYCTNGGWPLNVKISSIAALEDGPARLAANVHVAFTETGAACCSGVNFEYERFQILSLVIDKKDWSGVFGTNES